MKRVFVVAVALFFAANISFAESPTAAASAASEASINELLRITRARALIDDMMPQLESMMKDTMRQALNGEQPTKEQQAVLDKFLTKVLTAYKQDMSWEKMQPIYMRIYRDSFSQSEVDGMIEFYKSTSGKALVDKMPVVMKNTMGEMQKMMAPMMKSVQASAAEMQTELRALREKK